MWLFASVAFGRKVTGVVTVGSDNGARTDVAVLLKKPLRRKLSVSCLPTSAPARKVWRTVPVDAWNVTSVWLKRFRRLVELLYLEMETNCLSAVTAPGT